ncbi:hypothetical protein J3Q64DRAFT_1716041 [Phycomyces blakesleeanus]|uniref:Uncharacterized protein n=2 Tax=Phycomyces blakesleeanus TaxID=4837 RepID=A0A167QJL8_PHYB8|nr:hypothetical protein PHYBLDRAFT_179262 [Phycomyces blakesleeanus NRRL 1555(-)]OAD79799.1 hypothetical protein PHYBLDRAFT_179262 [Phycomyces blakesleeanus NRRL 1555(-)]|eukprot:XP_018297839.1 hypothetical protein PHYBLDRAFT_179262 [Phycomyces blakesleeanus NRRL 1555(-)]
MTGAFASLSHKRHRSPSTAKTPPTAPIGKLSKLKSGLSLFGRLANPFGSGTTTTNQDNSENDNEEDDNDDEWDQPKKYSLSALMHCFKSADPAASANPAASATTPHPLAGDALYEHTHYRQRSVCPAPPIYDPSPQAPLRKKSLPSILKKDPQDDHPTTPFIRHHRHTSSLQSSGLSVPSINNGRHKQSRHVRHYSHVSSSITVNSEDLTAKEFADYTGIRILSETDDDNEHTNSEDEDETKRCGCEDEGIVPVLVRGTHGRHKSCDTTTLHVNEDSQISIKSYCSMHSHDTRSLYRKPQIWDSDFWRKPGQPQPLPQQPNLGHKRSGSSIPTTPPLLSLTQETEPPIIHTMRKLNTLSTETLNQRNNNTNISQLVPPSRNCIIRKGRFEIHLESSSEPDRVELPTDECVVEWKRKQKSPLSQSTIH